MTARWVSPYIRLYQADARDLPLADESVDMVATSPPYFSMRQYSEVDPSEWGGDPSCEHAWTELPPAREQSFEDVAGWSTLVGGKRHMYEQATTVVGGQDCLGCGAWRGCLGLEPDVDCLAWTRGDESCPRCYVCHLVTIFREVRRVLRSRGVVFLNLGDKHAGSGGSHAPHHKSPGMSKSASRGGVRGQAGFPRSGLKPKDLVGAPWRVALALQADGWWLRQDILWHKLNSLPESIKDRFVTTHEYVFLLSRSQTYYFDQYAVRERIQPESALRMEQSRERRPRKKGYASGNVERKLEVPTRLNDHRGSSIPWTDTTGYRIKRSVWQIATRGDARAHFAIWPEALVEPMILAGTSEKGYCRWGQPWKRSEDDPGSWTPTCRCEDPEAEPGIVLDPFCGSGTTLAVAQRLGRRGIGVDLSRAYLDMTARRVQGVPVPMPMLDREPIEEMTAKALQAQAQFEDFDPDEEAKHAKEDPAEANRRLEEGPGDRERLQALEMGESVQGPGS